MIADNIARWIAVAVLAGLLFTGCKQDEPKGAPASKASESVEAPSDATPTPAPASVPPASLPPGHPPVAMPSKPTDTSGEQKHPTQRPTPPDPHAVVSQETELIEAPTEFEGLSLTPPNGWLAVKPIPSRIGPAFGPKAVFRLPGDEETVIVRLTHFPGMRNIPLEKNLARWYREFNQPDGRPTKDVATVETFEVGGVKITLANIPGSHTTRGIPAEPDQRMLAAIIEHPKGPHFLKVFGGEQAIARHKDAVLTYLRSAKVIP